MEKIFYPITQRRLRKDAHIRELSSSVHLSYKNFIQPVFVDEALTSTQPIGGLANVQVDTLSSILFSIENDLKSGISKFLLFPVPAQKRNKDFDFSFVSALVRAIKQRFSKDIWLAVDLCFCSYTLHGHCGILDEAQSKLINHKTVDELVRYATQLAVAGADCIAPSDMMDGRIAALRTQLDALNYDDISIMSYAAKFSSQFYGPFRDTCRSTPNSTGLRNRKSYQISPFNNKDALASAVRDAGEGADILMVKPAGLYTDIIVLLKQQALKPVAAYHVSGEYAALELLVEKGYAQREAVHTEVWAALQRSGADIIISYAARYAKQWIEQIEY